MWENTVERGRPQMTKMAHAPYMLDTEDYMRTHTHTEYVILIAFPLQQWLQERASNVTLYYTACLVCTFIHIIDSSMNVCMCPFKNGVGSIKE